MPSARPKRPGRLAGGPAGFPHIGQQLSLHMRQQPQPGLAQVMQLVRPHPGPIDAGQHRRELRPRRQLRQPGRQPLLSHIHAHHTRTGVRQISVSDLEVGSLEILSADG